MSRKVKRGKRQDRLLWKGTVEPVTKACCVQLTFSIKIFYQGLVTSFSSTNVCFHHPPLLFQRLGTTSHAACFTAFLFCPCGVLLLPVSVSSRCLRFPFYLMLSQCLQTCLSFPFLKRNYLPPYHPLLKQIPSLMSQLNFWKQ